MFGAILPILVYFFHLPYFPFFPLLLFAGLTVLVTAADIHFLPQGVRCTSATPVLLKFRYLNSFFCFVLFFVFPSISKVSPPVCLSLRTLSLCLSSFYNLQCWDQLVTAFWIVVNHFYHQPLFVFISELIFVSLLITVSYTYVYFLDSF